MDRKDLDELLIDERYGGESSSTPDGVEAEFYSEIKAEADVLDGMLAWSEDEPPRPGFDTRFYARLKDVQEEPEAEDTGWVERLLWLLLPIGALVMVAITLSSSSDVFEAITTSRDMGLAMELELLENYDVVRDLEEVEHFELLAQLDMAEMDSLENLEAGGVESEAEEATVQ